MNYDSIEFYCLCLKTRVHQSRIINFSSIYMSLSGRGGSGDGGARRESMNVRRENDREKSFYGIMFSWDRSN